jgi:hypothetical protein
MMAFEEGMRRDEKGCVFRGVCLKLNGFKVCQSVECVCVGHDAIHSDCREASPAAFFDMLKMSDLTDHEPPHETAPINVSSLLILDYPHQRPPPYMLLLIP